MIVDQFNENSEKDEKEEFKYCILTEKDRHFKI